jgi:predicted outer membrane repeat protein
VLVDSNSTATISGCTFTGVSAPLGGAIAVRSSGGPATLDVADTTFESCAAKYQGTNRPVQAQGGAIYLLGGINGGAPARATITRCTFRSGSAQHGGAVAVGGPGDSVDIVDSTFEQNEAAGQGGAIFGDASTSISIRGGSFSRNFATNYGHALRTVCASELRVSGAAFLGFRQSEQMTSTIYPECKTAGAPRGSVSIDASLFNAAPLIGETVTAPVGTYFLTVGQVSSLPVL